ncbi:MAG: DUF4097 family beta strand repeat-containing protein [Bacillus sp. (in: firmicutes)]
MLKKVLLTASIFIIIGIGGAIFTAKAYFKDSDVRERETITGSNINDIDLKTDYGVFEIMESETDDIMIETVRSKNMDKPVIKTSKNTLAVSSYSKAKFQFGINFKNIHNKIYVYLPKKQFENIQINNDVGSIDVQDIQATRLTASSKTGSIKITNAATNKMSIQSKVGSITIKGTTEELDLSSETGAIKVETDTLAHPVTASTDIGSSQITTVKKPEHYRITADSEIGSINIFGEDSNFYEHGEAKAHMQLKTETGSIKVNL